VNLDELRARENSSREKFKRKTAFYAVCQWFSTFFGLQKQAGVFFLAGQF
jgi:hypothetical protein